MKTPVHTNLWTAPAGALLMTVLSAGALAAAEEQGSSGPPAPEYWLVRPWQTEPRILQWAEKYPQLVSLQKRKTCGGHTAYVASVTNCLADNRQKQKLLFSQPHAHEPAPTAGMMDFLAQLLEGAHLDGRTSDLPRQKLLEQTMLTFIPDGNPDGRARAPEDWWDGTKYSNDQFLDFAFGRTQGGERCPRVGRWSNLQQQPALLGIVYEQINEHEFVEPNRDPDSTFFKLLKRMLQQHDYSLHVDLHQTEFEKSSYNAMVVLPFMQEKLPEPIRQYNRRLAAAIVQAWRKTGARPTPEARPLGYKEDQLQYFRKCWEEIYTAIPSVAIEVQNNNLKTPPRMQMEIVEAAIRASIEFALSQRADGALSKEGSVVE